MRRALKKGIMDKQLLIYYSQFMLVVLAMHVFESFGVSREKKKKHFLGSRSFAGPHVWLNTIARLCLQRLRIRLYQILDNFQ